MPLFRFLLLIAISLLSTQFTFVYAASSSRVIALGKGTEINYSHYPASGNKLFIWIYSEAGPQPSEPLIARQLQKKGIEVWLLELFDAWFLPVAASSMEQIPDGDMAKLIEKAHKQTGKQVYFVTTGRGAIPVLRGVRQHQLDYPGSSAFAGAILMSPKFFVETPDPGEESRLMPIVSASNLPLYVIQPEKSPWFWKLDTTIPALEKNGSDVFVQRIKGVRDRFYFRPDATEYENAETKKLPQILYRAGQMLTSLPQRQRKVVAAQQARPAVRSSKKERELKIYKGNPQPPQLRLQTPGDHWLDLNNYKGQVVLVNFWASWCPPCVHEMPSMEKLQKHFSGKAFTILGVNMAEDKTTIARFLKDKVSVSFPIVMDRDGAALKSWGVFAFPTSYVIDKQGKIRYALFGGVDWMNEEILKKLQALIAE